MRIFIVDDEEIACFGLKGMLRRILGKADNEISAFTSSVTALKEAERLRPDLIFLDITMPELSGIEFTEKIRQVYFPEIIIISGNDDYNFVRQCFKLNVKDYLLKPIESDELKKLLSKFENELSDKNEEKTINSEQLKYPYAFTAVIKVADLKEDIKRQVFNISSNTALEGKIKIQEEKGRFNDTAFTFYITKKFDYYKAVREFEGLFERLISGSAGVINGAYSSLYASGELEAAKEEMYILLQSRFYNEGSVCYSQQNKILRESDEDTEFFSKLSALPPSFSLENKEKYLDFILSMFVPKRLLKLSFENIEREYNAIIARLIDNSNLGEGLEIRNFKSFNTLSEAIFEIKRVVEGISNFYIENSKEDKNVIELAIKFINENYSKNITLATVSNRYDLNYSYFSRIFKDFIGISFSQYLLKIRMEKAKEMILNDEELKISDIAKAVGYSGDNVQNFTRAFKNHFGKSPKSFKK